MNNAYQDAETTPTIFADNRHFRCGVFRAGVDTSTTSGLLEGQTWTANVDRDMGSNLQGRLRSRCDLLTQGLSIAKFGCVSASRFRR